MLERGLRSNRRILPFRIAAPVAAYLAYELHHSGVGDNALSYFKTSGEEVVVFCPESKDAIATQEPARRRLRMAEDQPVAEAKESVPPAAAPSVPSDAPSPTAATAPVAAPPAVAKEELKEQHFTILYGDTGYSYESIMGAYLKGAKAVVIEDPYIRLQHQIQNFVRFCETVLKAGTVKKITDCVFVSPLHALPQIVEGIFATDDAVGLESLYVAPEVARKKRRGRTKGAEE